MKMNLKSIMLAGALALSFAGQASASIVAGGTYANNLVLTVWDTTNNTSYTANLGVTMQSLLSGAGVVAGGTAKAPALSGTDTTANNFSFTDAALNTFLSTASANTTWSVTAVNMAVTGYGTSGVMTTSTSTIAAASVSATQLNAMLPTNTGYVNAASTLMGAANSVATDSVNGGAAYAGAAGNGMGNNLGGNLYVSDMASVGQSQNFFFMTPTQNSRGVYAGSAVYEFGNAAGISQFKLTSTGLTYAVAAVPEPGEWLLMLSGLGLIGFIATRRKESGSMSFA